MVTAELSLVADPNDNGEVYRCEAKNKAISKAYTESITFHVLCKWKKRIFFPFLFFYRQNKRVESCCVSLSLFFMVVFATTSDNHQYCHIYTVKMCFSIFLLPFLLAAVVEVVCVQKSLWSTDKIQLDQKSWNETMEKNMVYFFCTKKWEAFITFFYFIKNILKTFL